MPKINKLKIKVVYFTTVVKGLNYSDHFNDLSWRQILLKKVFLTYENFFLCVPKMTKQLKNN